jgi:hypothetical protein
MDVAERERLDTGRRRVYRELLNAGREGLSNGELVTRTQQLDAPRRARELRASGFAIDVRREHGGTWRYTLIQSAPLALTLDRTRPVVPGMRHDDDEDEQGSLF